MNYQYLQHHGSCKANIQAFSCLSQHKQPDILKPHEKTRSVFFIFFEQVLQNILRDKRLPEKEPRE